MRKFFEGIGSGLAALLFVSILVFVLLVFPLWKGMPTFDFDGSRSGKLFGMPLTEAIIMSIIILVILFYIFFRYLNSQHEADKKVQSITKIENKSAVTPSVDSPTNLKFLMEINQLEFVKYYKENWYAWVTKIDDYNVEMDSLDNFMGYDDISGEIKRSDKMEVFLKFTGKHFVFKMRTFGTDDIKMIPLPDIMSDEFIIVLDEKKLVDWHELCHMAFKNIAEKQALSS